jgi:hypothetical protein
MNRLGDVAAVVGIGHTDWPEDHAKVRAGGKPYDSYGYAAVALKRALDDAGLRVGDVDGLLVGNVAYERAGETLGISPRWGGSCGAVDGVVQALMAISAGLAEVVALVYGNDQRSAKVQYGGPQAMGGEMALSYVYFAPWGLTSQGALYALMHRRYMELNGSTPADLGQVAVAQRQWASHNPHAVMRKPIALDDYLEAEYVAEPLRLFDYCMINDGGVAIAIASAERAKALGKRAVPIKAVARADMNEDATSLKPRLIDFYRPAQAEVAREVYAIRRGRRSCRRRAGHPCPRGRPRVGIDPMTLASFINVSTGRNLATLDDFPTRLLHVFETGGKKSIGVKDLELYLKETERLDMPVWATPRVLDLFIEGQAYDAKPADSLSPWVESLKRLRDGK